jgi:O-acetyl-ADP-ribose deacetylase (regulator of RNase III)
MNKIKGDLVKLALEGKFDVIVHGCNCFCTQGAGLAKEMNRVFNSLLYDTRVINDVNKLGTITYGKLVLGENDAWNEKILPKLKHTVDFDEEEARSKEIIVVNAYTQYYYGKRKPLIGKHHADYTAIRMCMRKINHQFKGKHIGLPLIGCGLAGGSWYDVEQIIEEELKDCKITIVYYEKN